MAKEIISCITRDWTLEDNIQILWKLPWLSSHGDFFFIRNCLIKSEWWKVISCRIYDMDNDGFISNGELFQVLKMMVMGQTWRMHSYNRLLTRQSCLQTKMTMGKLILKSSAGLLVTQMFTKRWLWMFKHQEQKSNSFRINSLCAYKYRWDNGG